MWVQVGEPQARSQMLLGVGREIIAAFGYRFAEPDRGEDVLQRFARTHVHDRCAGRYNGNAVARRDVLDGAAMDVVHRARVQCQGDPGAIAEGLGEPLDLRIQLLFVGRIVR